jgi:hypothetical protein
MTDQFHVFAATVRKQFNEMSRETLYVVDSDRDEIWQRYLSAFPEGSNPVFRERTEHDCSCCRQFIRSIGNVVAIQNGALASVWDLAGLPHPYQDVANAMSAYVKSLAICDAFLTPQAKHGTAKSFEHTIGGARTWHHFAVEVPSKFVTSRWSEKRGEIRTTASVLLRGLMELAPSAVATVADLIRENSIYRGQEFQGAVLEFQALQARVLAEPDSRMQHLLAWQAVKSPVARFRNTVIGTLVQDLSDGIDLEIAVRAYESKVAPQNYKRPTALITKAMVDEAMKTIEELGLEPALERRHARLSDVSVNSVLFVDNAVRGKMKDGSLKGLLMEEVRPAPFDPTKTEMIGIDAFVTDVLPRTTGLQLYLENSALGNFVSLTAPAHADSKSLFRWSNDFAWSYDGNVTDSIKDKVKRAGGQVENVFMRVSLAWSNTDDLDLHVIEPDGNHIYFGNKSCKLDVDMNVINLVRDPVENIRWVRQPRRGLYRVFVHNYNRRESVDGGFVVEIETPKGIETLRYRRHLPSGAQQDVAELRLDGRGGVEILPEPDMSVGSISQERWGLRTLNLARVNSVVLSPNHWDDNAVGNKHWIFILDGCKNPLPARGIYNEFLHPRLEKHRKVFEVLGDKTKCPVAEEQLSGVGFSSTRQDKVTVVATGPNLNKAYTIVFGKET